MSLDDAIAEARATGARARTSATGARGDVIAIARPGLAVVYAYDYPDDAGDLVAWAEGGPILRNGVPTATAPRPPVVLVPPDLDPAATAACVAPARFRELRSFAYRLALVACGEADAAVSLDGPDRSGAGDALVRAAGGEVVQHGRVCVGGTPAALASARWPTPGPARPARRVADSGRLARAHGCLLGQLAGDALGELVEFQSPGAIARRFPGGVRDIVDGGTWNTIAGQPTDDSELALSLARTVVRDGRFDPASVLGAYLDWYRSDPFDIGGTTAAALGARAPRVDSQSNGSLMRASPLGILGAGRPDDAAAWARADSALTHPNPVCQESCAGFVAAIAAAIAGGDAHAAALAATRRPEVRAALERAQGGPPASYTEHEGWVLIALQNAFFQLRSARSFEEALVDTVGRGGDTDTNGAIAGALLGAVHGREAIPLRWRRAVLTCRPVPGTPRPRPPRYWPVDALELAEALLTAGA